MSILIDGRVLLLRRDAALRLGLNEAIVLQQISYWTTEKRGHKRDGKVWVYKTYDEWQAEFPWWSTSTIKRIILKLEEIGVLVSSQDYNKMKLDKTKWYAIDREHPILNENYLDDHEGNLNQSVGQSDTTLEGDLTPTITIEYPENTDIEKEGSSVPSEPLVKPGGNKITKGKEKKSSSEVLDEVEGSSEVWDMAALIAEANVQPYTQKVLFWFWRNAVLLEFPEMKPLNDLSIKDKQHLKNIVSKIGRDEIYEKMAKAIGSWDQFTKHCESGYGAFNSPEFPTVFYVQKHGLALNTFYAGEKLGDTPKKKAAGGGLTHPGGYKG